MLLPTRQVHPRETLAEHAEASPHWTFGWKCHTVRHTNLQCLSMPPLLPLTCRVDPVRISPCTQGWQNDQTIMWLLLWSYTWTTTWNMCSQQSLPMTMPTPSTGTPIRHRLHLGCRWTCKSTACKILEGGCSRYNKFFGLKRKPKYFRGS